LSRPDEGRSEADRQAGWREKVSALPQKVMNFWLVKRVMAVMEAANAAGGPLMAAALAFVTMFAIIPSILLITGALGWLIEDPATREELLAELVAMVPPLAEALADSLERVVEARGPLSIVGLVGLLWGASNFYQALDEVMRRLFPGGEMRGFVSRRVRGVVAILVLMALVLGTIVLGGVWAFLDDLLGEIRELFFWQLVPPVLSILVIIVVVLIVYRLVPTAPPDLRAALPPAIVAGIGIGLLTNLFTLLAPWLIGGLTAFGLLASVFGAFIWLNFCFQMLIYGAAWARYRRDRRKLEAEVD
jgi:membrane protein